MNDVQAAAIAKVDASMKPVHDLYEQRCYLWRLSCRLPLRDLQRLNALLAKLSDDDLRMVATFAEGLAEWSSGDASCPDAPETTRQTAEPPADVRQAAAGRAG
jgi:hypothetical protein